MRNFLTLTVALLSGSSALAHTNQPLSPKQVVALVRSKGAKAAVSEIWKSESKIKILLAGVSTGNLAWLQAAKAIKPATDAGSAEDLNDAFAEALINNPYVVLPWLHQLWWQSEQNICVFAYDSELPGGVSAYVAKLESALSKQPPVRLQALQVQCLQGIKQTKRALFVAPQ